MQILNEMAVQVLVLRGRRLSAGGWIVIWYRPWRLMVAWPWG